MSAAQLEYKPYNKKVYTVHIVDGETGRHFFHRFWNDEPAARRYLVNAELDGCAILEFYETAY